MELIRLLPVQCLWRFAIITVTWEVANAEGRDQVLQ